MDSPEIIGSDPAESFWERIFHQQNKAPSRKRTDYPCKHEFVAWEYTRHNDGPDALQSAPARICPVGHFEQGLSTTRFHKGFQRRMQSSIRQDAARLDRQAHKQRQSSLHLVRRRQRLGTLDKRNGFNLITGQFDPANRRCTTPFHVQPKTRENGGLSEVAERTEYLLLRDSEYKFHAPAWSGNNHDKRQDLLQREGLNKPKKSALLGIGGADLASAGAEDMFSKSIYDPAKACAIDGLVEKTRPGRYTPRKVTALGRLTTTPRKESEYYGSGGLRAPPSSSRAALNNNNVFRVLPVGLSNGTLTAQMARGSAAAVVLGIAPPKPNRLLLESRSAPSLTRQSKVNTGGETGDWTTSRARDLSEPVSSRRDGRMLLRTADIALCGSCRDSDGARNSSGGSGSLARRSAFVGRLPSTAASSSSSSNHGSEGLQRGDSPSPAERKADVQLASDMAIVRSLQLDC